MINLLSKENIVDNIFILNKRFLLSCCFTATSPLFNPAEKEYKAIGSPIEVQNKTCMLIIFTF